jgi:hypothetical protein
LAFWDKTDRKRSLVIACHGVIKKVDKMPIRQIEKAIQLRQKYFNAKIK